MCVREVQSNKASIDKPPHERREKSDQICTPSKMKNGQINCEVSMTVWRRDKRKQTVACEGVIGQGFCTSPPIQTDVWLTLHKFSVHKKTKKAMDE
jgi:hypothetical protein